MSDQMKPYFFIVNPVAGNGKGKEYAEIIKRLIPTLSENQISLTERVGHASELANDAMGNGYKTIVAVGGDGTANEVGSALIGKDVGLGLMPVGSGNGLARHLGTSMHFKNALNTLIKGDFKQIDTGLMNGRAFLNAAGIGIDAEVSKQFSDSVKRGWFNYLKII